ncbi:anaerobic dehydrogenase, typically selenocysteine-containing [Desulfosporosinus orientis DSM 765]|uniref:Anaerobic dehydrogenase, typically selenocysteine-containing n=1 Tax=Desulfosporosinus orientis (strain ATCC 19365 / DSM 765 / NCIMB 8382 / VKM B-1628 / Singapore I) TaxID=768706 RepID=G7W6E4_DESOD|nr:molybdopterin-dependent oxidoreductase [Desulfosporosinus orientis]AET68151.1 anaerobic dehydrogenase, typically selenocysteine-containing [Desulfosporosinus orientis DSM 765]
MTNEPGVSQSSGFKMSRRSFIKGSSAVVGAAIAGGVLLDTGRGGLVETKTAKAAGTEKWVKSYCGSCIWANCGTEVKVVDGVAVELRGNKDHPNNQGTLCPRGSAQLMSTYNPYRVKTPLKRTNPEKGLDVDPKWVEISWDEAISTIAQRLKSVMASDPRKFMWTYGFSTGLHECALAPAHVMTIGSPNNFASAGPLCDVHYAPATFNASYVDRIDMNYCNYIVTFGRNLGGAAMFASGPGRALANALERGLKIVSVDPHCNAEASKGEWVPIRPATDLAMGFAMLNVILHELNEYDVHAMKFRSDGPYLIGGDGDYLRGAGGKPQIWDAKDGQAKDYDDPTLTDPALEGDFLVNGVKASSGFMVLKEHVKQYTPEWAEPITDVPAATIRRITKELVDHACIGQTIIIDGHEMPYRPACVAVGRGAANEFQGQAFYYIADVINLVIGAIGVPGSVVSNLPFVLDVKDGLLNFRWVNCDTTFSIPARDYSGGNFYPRTTFAIPGHTIAAILDPKKHYLDYELEVMFTHGTNQFIAEPNREDAVAAWKKFKFIFSLAYVLDENTMLSDIVLPEHSLYERQQIRQANETMTVGDNIRMNGWNYRENILEKPLYDSIQYEELWTEIFAKMGPEMLGKWNAICNMLTGINLDVTQKHTYSEIVDARLKEVINKDPNKGIDFMREKGFLDIRLPLSECYDYYYLGINSKTRLHMFDMDLMRDGKTLFKNLAAHGIKEIPGWEGKMDEVERAYEPLPTWYDNRMSKENQEFDLYAVNWKISCRNLGAGGQDDNPYLREVVEKWDIDDVRIQMNEKMAAEKGLKTGDKVEVESITGGKATGIIKTTNLVRYDCLGFAGQGGRISPFVFPGSRKGSNYNQLLSNRMGDILPESGSIPNSVRVKIKKAN